MLLGLRVALGPYRGLAEQPAALFRPVWFLTWLDRMPPVEVIVAVQVVGVLAAALAVDRLAGAGHVLRGVGQPPRARRASGPAAAR